MKPKRTILSISATSVADFRAKLDAQIVEAQRVAGVPMLPPDDDDGTDDAALVAALATAVERVCMIQSPVEQAKAA